MYRSLTPPGKRKLILGVFFTKAAPLPLLLPSLPILRPGEGGSHPSCEGMQLARPHPHHHHHHPSIMAQCKVPSILSCNLNLSSWNTSGDRPQCVAAAAPGLDPRRRRHRPVVNPITLLSLWRATAHPTLDKPCPSPRELKKKKKVYTSTTLCF